MSDPIAPRVRRTANFSASQVEIIDGIAYVAAGSSLVAYDVLSGEKLKRISLGGSTITGVADEGSTIVTMNDQRTLRVVTVSGYGMTARGNLSSPHGDGNVSLVNGIAYVAPRPSFNQQGYAAVDVTVPTSPGLIAGTNVSGGVAFPGTAIVPMGRGWGYCWGRRSPCLGRSGWR